MHLEGEELKEKEIKSDILNLKRNTLFKNKQILVKCLTTSYLKVMSVLWVGGVNAPRRPGHRVLHLLTRAQHPGDAVTPHALPAVSCTQVYFPLRCQVNETLLKRCKHQAK